MTGISSSAQCCQAALQIDDSSNVERAAEPSAAGVFCRGLLLNSESTAAHHPAPHREDGSEEAREERGQRLHGPGHAAQDYEEHGNRLTRRLFCTMHIYLLLLKFQQ